MHRVIINFLGVTKVRPQDRDVEANNSDEHVVDTECFVQADDLSNALLTATGGANPRRQGKSTSQYENSLQAIHRVQQLWALHEDRERTGPGIARRIPRTTLNPEEMLSASRAGAKDSDVLSRRQEVAESVHIQTASNEAQVNAWMRLHAAELNDEQRRDLRRVAKRCVAESTGCKTTTGDCSEPVRWLTHRKPGVGKTKLVHIVF